VERRVGDVTVLDLTGRLVFEEGDSVLRAHVNRLLEQGRIHLVVNLRDVTYVDSCGIGVLVSKYVSLRRKGGDLRFVNVTPRSHRLLEITRLVNIVRLFDTEEEAIASYSKTSTM
jgi:anti-anti-sigma factor